MYLRRLILKNYRLFRDVDISFQHGMNVLIGKNSTGKSTVLEAINFLLSSNNANVPAEEIIPYDIRNQQNAQVLIEGYFEMSDIEKDSVCSTIKDPNDYDMIKETGMVIIYKKIITKTGEITRVNQEVESEGYSDSRTINLLNHVFNSMVPKMQTNNVLKVTDIENNNNAEQLRPLYELMALVSQYPSFLGQYLRNILYDIKQGNINEFIKIKSEIIKAYSEMSDMDIEFDPKRAQVQIYFKKHNSNIKIPLESEGAGIREFLYLMLTLRNFPDTIILKDEALTHLHKSLLSDFILAIDGLQYQMITTSHIKELIMTLDFGNIIICRKCDDNATAKNLMQAEEIDKLLDELGYPINDIPEIDSLIQKD